MIYDPMPRSLKVLVALSQLVNVAIMPRHTETEPGETLSGRAHRQGWRIRHVINRFFFWQEDHCKVSYLYDVKRARDYIAAAEAGAPE
jgi:hypothetical protein